MNQPKKLQISPKDLAKVERAKARAEGVKVSPEWMFVCRFGHYYGWEGMQAIMKNEIDLETASMLLRGAEKLHAADVIDFANASYVASVASRSKKGGQVMKKGLAGYVKASRMSI